MKITKRKLAKLKKFKINKILDFCDIVHVSYKDIEKIIRRLVEIVAWDELSKYDYPNEALISVLDDYDWEDARVGSLSIDITVEFIAESIIHDVFRMFKGCSMRDAA